MKKTARQLQKERTRESLIRTAYALFSERGILNTRMADIAEAAGVSQGTVVLHFKTQEALVVEVIGTYCGKIAARTHELADSGCSVREMLSAHLAGIGEFEPFYARLVMENRLLPPPARDAWVGLQSAVSFHFSRAVERERRAGTVAEVPDSLLFNLWTGFVHHYLANRDLFAPEGGVIVRYGETLVETYLKLIRRPADGTKGG